MLTPSQLATLKAHIAANTSTIPTGQPWTGSFGGTQVNAVPNIRKIYRQTIAQSEEVS